MEYSGIGCLVKMYLPAEDSIFFSEFLENYFLKLPDKKISYLDMGCGSGILSEAAKQAKIKKILAVDIDNESVEFVKKKGTPVKISNLFSNLKDENFDIITFNAPYLPEDKHDFQKDTTGGKNGDDKCHKIFLIMEHL